MFHLFAYGFDGLCHACACDAVADAELAHRVPSEFPDFLCRTPDAAQRSGARAKFCFVIVDAHGDDVIGRPAQAARTWRPRARLDDQFDRLVAAIGRGIVEIANGARVRSIERT
jgi:hypothetical protein